MRITFEEEGHIYSVNGDIASISTTELLHKHGLAPDYTGVAKSKMKASAEKGKEVHKDLENILNTASYEPKTEQGKNFKDWVKENLDCGIGEQMLAYNYKGIIIAGTADVMGYLKDGKALMADHKNTVKFNREYVTWQCSLNDYFARKLKNEAINGKKFNNWKGAKVFMCFQYNPKTGELTTYELEKVPDAEIERLLECEANGEIYERKTLQIDPELKINFLRAEEAFVSIEKHYKKAEEELKKFRAQLAALCEKQKVYGWESPSGLVKLTYVMPREEIRIDSDKVKKEFPQVYQKCHKIIHKKGYVLVTVREKEEGEQGYVKT